MKSFFLALSFIIFGFGSHAEAQSPRVPFKITKVLDGDTLRGCLVDPAPGIIVTQCFSVRVNNLNTPEKRLCHARERDAANACERCAAGSTLGLRATKAAQAIFEKSPRVMLEVLNKDRYNRVVGNITLATGADYAQTIIDLKLGVAYPCKNGGCGARPRPWCPD